MARHPTHDAEVAKGAARSLGNAPMCILLYLNRNGKEIALATFGETPPLAKFAADLGDHLFEVAMKYGDDPS